MSTPDVKGPYGEAWRYPLPAVGARKTRDQDGTLAAWLVYAPKSHLIWPHKLVSVIHLRDIPGVKPAYRSYPEAEYELNIVSLDPEKHPNPVIEDVDKGLSMLHPPDVIVQFHRIKDEQVIMMLDWAIQAIVDGHLVPDQDYRSHWREAVQTTIAHIIDGSHAMA
jgi:hypothetical protein